MYFLVHKDTQRLIINVKFVIALAKLVKKLQLLVHLALMDMYWML